MHRPIRSDSLCDAVALRRPPCCFSSTAELKNRPRLLHLAGQHVLVLSYCHMQETVSKLKYFYWLFLSDSCFYEFPRCLSWMKKKDFSFFFFYLSNSVIPLIIFPGMTRSKLERNKMLSGNWLLISPYAASVLVLTEVFNGLKNNLDYFNRFTHYANILLVLSSLRIFRLNVCFGPHCAACVRANTHQPTCPCRPGETGAMLGAQTAGPHHRPALNVGGWRGTWGLIRLLSSGDSYQRHRETAIFLSFAPYIYLYVNGGLTQRCERLLPLATAEYIGMCIHLGMYSCMYTHTTT